MSRLSLSENMLRLRAADRRSPVENALWAVRSLSDAEKLQFEALFNAKLNGREPSVTIQVIFREKAIS
mgnify:CR=1 FL=1